MKRPWRARFWFQVWRLACRLPWPRLAGRIIPLIHSADGLCMARGGQFRRLCHGRAGHKGPHFEFMGDPIFGPIWRNKWTD